MADKNQSNLGASGNLLPGFYRTDANKKFLQATIDQLIQPGKVKKVNGYIGRQNAKATTGSDIFVAEPTQVREDYQLEPSFVVKDDLDNITFFKDYADYINQLNVFEANTTNHSRLSSQEFYSWDPHINWDKFSNFQNYYWLPYGPDVINIAGQQQAITSTYEVLLEVEADTTAYIFSPKGTVGLVRDPTIKLYRGQTYNFEINSPGNPFAIKTERTSGDDELYIVESISNNQIEVGTITLTIPYDAPDLLYYVNENDIDVGGTFEILSINENTEIDVEKEILGKKNYILADGTPLSNGMKITFVGKVTPASYSLGFYYVEGVGDSISLIDERSLELISQYTVSETILFDDIPFDSKPFADATSFAGTPDYVVINRSSKDRNPWSRYNRWFHKDVIETSARFNNKVPSIDQSARAVRPIIEFEADLKLYNFGTSAIIDVDLVDTFTQDAFSLIEGQLGYNIDGIPLAQDQKILFVADTDSFVKNNIYRVNFLTLNGNRQIHLELVVSPSENDVVLVKQGIKNQGKMFWFNGVEWNVGQQKNTLNQAPLFDVVDSNKVSYGDTSVYIGTTFKGTKVFSYKVGTGINDSNLGFPLSYKNIDNIGDILFNFDLATDTFSYKVVDTINTQAIDTGFLIKTINATSTYVNGWQKSKKLSVQPGIRIFKNSNLVSEFPIDLFDDISKLNDLIVKVYVNGIRLDQIDPSDLQNPNWTIDTRHDYKYVVLKNSISLTDVLTIKTVADQPINDNGYYEIPINLQNNPLNESIINFTLGEVIDHVNSIVDNLTDFVGSNPGAGNLRDLGNITQYGTKFVQHSGPLSLVSYHITSETNNIIRSIEEARKDYTNFKRIFVAAVDKVTPTTDSIIDQVDLMLQEINKDKPKSFPYYFTDMVPYGAKIVNNHIVIDYRIKTYPLTKLFSLAELSTRAVLVYRTDVSTKEVEQLMYNRDYTFSSEGFVVINSTIAENDIISIHEFENTNGSFVPATPTKLGLWPKYEPKIYVDTSLVTPRTMIQGHDGSLILAYDDFRDDLILELEKRIFNNIKTEYDPEIFNIHDIIPGYNRSTAYSLSEVNAVLAPNFYKWTASINQDFSKQISYDRTNPLTYNYKFYSSPNGQPVPGYWKGIHRWMLDTDRPNICPWEMLGFSIEPTWWQDVYGPAPYTSDNLILWNDMADGIVREPGKPIIRLDRYKRPVIKGRLPVNEFGDLISPMESGLASGIITQSTFDEFVFGDVGPVESAWRRNSHYPFSVIITSMLLYPAKTFGLLLDRSRIVKNLAGQLVYKDTGLRIKPKDIVFPNIYSSSSTVQTAGIINYIIDFIIGSNLSAFNTYKTDLANITANLSYRIGGFTSKEKFRFILESKTPLSSSAVFVPSEDYSIIFNTSSSIKKITYSGIMVIKGNDGFEVRGYSKTQPYFKYYPWVRPGATINIGGISEAFTYWTPGERYSVGSIVKYDNDYYRTLALHTAGNVFDTSLFSVIPYLPIVGGRDITLRTEWDRTSEIVVAYGTKFVDIQDVVDFILGYGEWLKDQGFIFDDFNPNLNAVANWETSAKEFTFWTTQNWSSGQDKWKEWQANQPIGYQEIVRYNGDYYQALQPIEPSLVFDLNKFIKLDGLSTIGSSIISLSPSAAKITFSTSLSVVDDIRNSFNGYEMFGVDGRPIAAEYINSYRIGNMVGYTPTDPTSAIYCATFYLKQQEQVVLFNNSTMFNDTIYNPVTGYRQERVKSSGYKTIDWDGSFNAPGFIYDRAVIQYWENWKDYHLGDIVKYKEYYYSAKTFLVGSEQFNMNDWVKLDDKPEPKLLPNWSYKAGQFEDFYSLDSDNFDSDQQTVAQHLIGYQKRQYLDNIIKDDVSEYKFYQGMITEKGTQNVLNKLFDVLSADGQESLTFYEEWALRVGNYGASGAFENIEFILDETQFKNNPQGFELVSQGSTNVDLIIRQSKNDVYVKPVGYDLNPFPTTQTGLYLRSPGYVRLSDVSVALTTIADIVNENIDNYNNGSYFWCGFEQHEWNVYKLLTTSLRVDSITVNGSTITIKLQTLVPFAVGTYIGIPEVSIKGFYRIESVSLDTFTISYASTGSAATEVNPTSIMIFELKSQRLSSINDVDTIDVIGNGELLWTDDDSTGKWATWEYNKVYASSLIQNTNAQVDDDLNVIHFGKNVFVNNAGNIVGVATSQGEIITYDKVSPTASWIERQTIPAPFISDPVGIYYPTDPSESGNVIAISSDNRWLATGTPTASHVSVKLLGNWTNLTTYHEYDIVLYNGTYYQGQSSVRLILSTTITASAGSFVFQASSGAYGYLSETFTVSDQITIVQVSETAFVGDSSGSNPECELIISNDETPSTSDSAVILIASQVITTINSGIIPSTNPGYWKALYYVPIDSTGSNNSLTQQGVVSIYERDNNNTFTLVDTIISPVPVSNELFGSSLAFSDNSLFVGAVGCNSNAGKVYRLDYQDRVVTTSIYNPVGSLGKTIKVSTTRGIKFNMKVRGTGFTQGQIVFAVIDDTTLLLSAAPDSVASGTLEFYETKWGYDTFTGLNSPALASGDKFGYKLSMSVDSSTLVVSAPGTLLSGKVYVYDNISGSNTLKQTIVGSDVRFGESTTITTDGTYIAISSIYYDGMKIDQGTVLIYKNIAGTYSLYQELANAKPELNEHFGSKIFFTNNDKTIVIYSDSADTYIPQIFDSSTTTFDQLSTTFVEYNLDSGRIDVYDNYGDKWVFSESLEGDIEDLDQYGTGIAVGANHIIVSSPNAYDGNYRSGLVYEYKKDNDAFTWTKIRKENVKVDPYKIKQAFLYNRVTNKLVSYLDVVDVTQGKIPGPAEQEIKFKTFYDPAVYSVGTASVNVDDGMSWSKSQVGTLWWDLRTAKFIESHDTDIVYRNSSWNMMYPTASIDVYEWVGSKYRPEQWDKLADTEAGLVAGISGTTLYGAGVYSIVKRYDNVSNSFVNTYYYWVKNKKTIPPTKFRTMSAQDVANLIENPRGEGYRYLAVSGSNSFSLINVKPLLERSDVVLSIEYWTVNNLQQNVHSQWSIVSNESHSVIPKNIEKKWFDSLCGKDENNRLVPDFELPPKLRYGIQNRPRQGMFVNRFEALKQLIEQVNRLLIQHQISEQRDLSGLETYDQEPNAVRGLYDMVLDTDLELSFSGAGVFITPSISPVITNGKITGVNITEAGKGYGRLNPKTYSDIGEVVEWYGPYVEVIGSGTDATIRSVINSSGQIIKIEIVNPGYGYNSDTVFVIRNYSVLVHSDTQGDNGWGIYTYDPESLVWSRLFSQSFDTRRYWQYVDWYQVGYNQFTSYDYAVESFADLTFLEAKVGEIIKINTTNSGKWMLVEKYNDTVSVDWTQIYKTVGIENGTIQFLSSIYEYLGTTYGYDGTLYDALGFDIAATTEIRYILTALRDNILIDEFKDEYLNLFFTTVRYALSEQLYVDWIFKTSFVKATHNVGDLKQKVTYNNDNLPDFEAYVAEVKPYRTQIREYISSYSKTDINYSANTDFDLPSLIDNNILTSIGTTMSPSGIEVDNAAIFDYPWRYWYDNVGFSVTELRIFDGGDGYIFEPTVRFASEVGSGATARAFITNGKVNRIVLLTPGEKYIKAPTVIIDGGLAEGGTAAKVFAIIGNSVVRSNLIKMKFDRITSTYLVTQLQETELFTGTLSRVQFPLKWGPDLRVGTSFVTINGVEELRDNYRLYIIKSTSRGYTSYAGSIIFNTPPGANTVIEVTYLKDWSLLNAADRIQYYYNPTSGQLGKDLSQLMTGVDYGGVIVNGLGFDVSAGWDSVPFYSDKWDSFDTTFEDYIVTVAEDTHTFTLPYTPDNGTEINVYYSKLDSVSYVSDGNETGYTFSVFDVYPPTITVSKTVKSSLSSNDNLSGTTTLVLASTSGIEVGDIVTTPSIVGFATATTSVTRKITLSSTTGIIVGERIRFVGDSVGGLISDGLYYVRSKNGNQITVSETITGTITNVSTDTGSMKFVTLGVIGYGTTVVSVIDNTSVEISQIIFGTIPTNTDVKFTRTLIDPTDCTINQNGTVFLKQPASIGSIITISSPLRPVRLDDPNFGEITQSENAIMLPWIANGVSNIIEIPSTFVVQEGDKFILRKSTSDGSYKPQESDYDTALSGGDLAYSTATGLLAEDILVDGDGFVTPTTSPAPEEVVPGQVVDAVAIKVFDKPNNGSANIRIDNYIGDGSTVEFVANQRLNSADALIVTVTTGYFEQGTGQQTTQIYIKTKGIDYTFDYNNSIVAFDAPPAQDDIITIYSLGFNGLNIIDLGEVVSNGAIDEIITEAPAVDDFIMLVYANGVQLVEPNYQVFITDNTYNNSNRIGIRFPEILPDQMLINYIIVAGTQQTFSITKSERITATGASEYDITNIAGNMLPVETSMIVRVNNRILRGPSNSYFTVKSNKFTYSIDPTKYEPYTVQATDIIVIVDQNVLILNKDYTVNAGGISIKLNKTICTQNANKELIISIKSDQGYAYVPGIQPKIILDRAYFGDEIIEIITSYNHDILNINRTTKTLSSTVSITPNTVEYYEYKKLRTGQLVLENTVEENYVWLIKNETLLTPAVDYKLNDDKKSITLATNPKLKDTFTIMTFNTNVITSGIAYMQFKDMLNRTHFKRLSLNKQTTLVTPLYYNDLTILVDNASTFDTPNPSSNKPGVIEIRGERIEYFDLYTGNYTDENGTREIFYLSKLRRGTLGTGIPRAHKAGAIVQEIGQSETIPYNESEQVEQIVSDGTNIVQLSFAPTKTIDTTWFTDLGYTFIGEYSDTRTYAINDVVLYNNYYYASIQSTTGVTPTTLTHWEKYTSIPATYGQTNDIEVFVGGYNISDNWAPNTIFAEGTIVILGSYTYQTSQRIKTGSTFISAVTILDINNNVITENVDHLTVWNFFIGNIRLKKVPYMMYNVNNHPESPDGDVRMDAEFAVDGVSKEIRLTHPLSFGTRVTVIRKTGRDWDGKQTPNIQYDNTKIAMFLKSTPGVWHTGIDKYESAGIASTFDSETETFDSITITFDQG